MDRGLGAEQFGVLGKAFRAKQGELNISVARIAQKTALDRRTIQQALSGHTVREGTLRDLCEFFDLDLDMLLEGHLGPEIASMELGGYARHNVSDHEGKFYAYRPNFREDDCIVRTLFEIKWDNSSPGLTFQESHRYETKEGRTVDSSQSGQVYRSAETNLFHLKTEYRGAIRLITVRAVSSAEMEFAGVVLTQFDDVFVYRPAVAPIVLCRAQAGEELDCGILKPGDENFSRTRKILQDVAARFVVTK